MFGIGPTMLSVASLIWPEVVMAGRDSLVLRVSCLELEFCRVEREFSVPVVAHVWFDGNIQALGERGTSKGKSSCQAM